MNLQDKLQTRTGPGHIYAFDLLRVIALAGVLLFHFAPRQAPLGLLGVVGFFALSGYLCMLKAIYRPRPHQLGRELVRRVYRLYPALIFMLFGVSLAMIISFPQFLPNFAGQVRASLLGVNNLYQIFHGDSYFEGAGYLKPLTHIWALSLEIQFYLVFYLLIYWTYSRRNRLAWLLLFSSLTLASLTWLNLIYQPDLDPSRIYYGLDTRFSAFGLGLIAALVRHEFRPYPAKIQPEADPADPWLKWSNLLNNLAKTCFSILLVVLYFYPADLTLTIRYGLFIYALLYAGLLYACAPDRAWLTWLGRTEPVQYLAQQSYFIYLWHYPILLLLQRWLSFSDLAAWAYPLVALALTLVLSEGARLTVKLGKKLWQKLVTNRLQLEPKQVSSWLTEPSRILSLSLALVLLATPWTLIYDQFGGRDLVLMQEKIEAQEKLLLVAQQARLAQIRASQAPSPSQSLIKPSESQSLTGPGGRPLKGRLSLTEPDPEQANYQAVLDQVSQQIRNLLELDDPHLKLDLAAYQRYRQIPVSIIGDSVSVISSYHLEPYLPQAYIDALSNRQMGDLWAVYSQIKQLDLVGQILVVALSTNGDVVPDQLEQVWQDLDGKPLVLVTIALPYPGQEEYRNNDLRKFAQDHDQVWLVEWDKCSHRHPEFFMDDLIHPADPLGCQAYCHLIAGKITEICQTYADAGRLDILPNSTQGQPARTASDPDKEAPATTTDETTSETTDQSQQEEERDPSPEP